MGAALFFLFFAKDKKGDTMGRKKVVKEKELLAAIKDSSGFYSVIAKRLGCSWHAVQNAIERSPEAQQALLDEEETTLDFVEGKALARIKAEDGAMIRFYLATKGKKRGYTYEEEEPAHGIESDDNELKIVIEDGDE